jgi:hypothetical protein
VLLLLLLLVAVSLLLLLLLLVVAVSLLLLLLLLVAVSLLLLLLLVAVSLLLLLLVAVSLLLLLLLLLQVVVLVQLLLQPPLQQHYFLSFSAACGCQLLLRGCHPQHSAACVAVLLSLMLLALHHLLGHCHRHPGDPGDLLLVCYRCCRCLHYGVHCWLRQLPLPPAVLLCLLLCAAGSAWLSAVLVDQ